MADILDMTEQIKELTDTGYSSSSYICDVSEANQVQKMIEGLMK